MAQESEDPAGRATGEVLGGSDCESVSPENNSSALQVQRSTNLQVIYVELFERRRKRGGYVDVASCSIAEVEGTAAPICCLARELLRLGIDPKTALSIWRGRTKCFVDAAVSRWSRLTVKEGQSGPVFAPYVPFSGIPVASGSAESDD